MSWVGKHFQGFLAVIVGGRDWYVLYLVSHTFLDEGRGSEVLQVVSNDRYEAMMMDLIGGGNIS